MSEKIRFGKRDEGGGEAGIAQSGEDAVASGEGGWKVVVDPGKEFGGYKGSEGRVAGAFDEPCIHIDMGDVDDEERLEEALLGKLIDYLWSLDAVSVEFRVEYDEQFQGCGIGIGFLYPEFSFIAEVVAFYDALVFGHCGLRGFIR